MAAKLILAGGSSGNPTDQIVVRPGHFRAGRLRVQPDIRLGCVSIEVDGVPCLMAPAAALELALRLTQAVGELS